jgi:hypothetical protein
MSITADHPIAFQNSRSDEFDFRAQMARLRNARASKVLRPKGIRSPERKGVSSQRGVSRRASGSYGSGVGNVSAEELQMALIFVLALYASMALVNLGAEWPSLLQHWHVFVEFLADGIVQP